LDPSRFIAQLCRRFRVPPEFGRRLQPLVQRAAESEPEKQRLLLEMVERSFAEEARRMERERASLPGDEWRALNTVAGVLHGWNAPEWFDRWDEEPDSPP
jgi:hypothetical protein